MLPEQTFPSTRGLREIVAPWTLPLILATIGLAIMLACGFLYDSFASGRFEIELILLFTILAAWPMVRDAINHRFDLFEARNVFLFFFILYVISLPLLSYLAGQAASDYVSKPAIFEALLLSTISLIAFYLGYRSSWGTRLAHLLPRLKKIPLPRITRSSLIFIALLVGIFCVFLYQIGGLSTYLNAGYEGVYEIEQGHEHFAFAMNVFPICMLLLYHLAARHKMRPRWAIGLLISLGAFCTLFQLVGKRRLLLSTLLGILIYRHYVQKKLSLQLAAALLLVGVIATSVLGILRAVPLQDIIGGQLGSIIKNRPSSDLFYAFLDNGEFSVTFESFPKVIEASHLDTPYLYGSSYLGTFRLLIPKIFDPNRPPTAAEWYAQTYFPAIANKLGGRAFFFLAEAYWNFGALGPPCLTFLVGIACRLCYDFMAINRRVPEAALLYAAAMSTIPSYLRIDFATYFKGSLVASLPFLVLVIWHSSRGRDSHIAAA